MAAVSSMGSRRVPGAMPRSVERHFTVPTLLEERTATMRIGSGENLEGFESRLMGSSYNVGSSAGTEDCGGATLNWGTYKTTNSVYGEENRTGNGASRSGMDITSPAFQVRISQECCSVPQQLAASHSLAQTLQHFEATCSISSSCRSKSFAETGARADF
jgi:hypothetical protein